MSVRIEKNGSVWTVIHSRPEVRNAMDQEHATELYEAFREFDAEAEAKVAVFWGEGDAFCSGWDLKRASELSDENALKPYEFPDEGEPPMAAMGPSRLELSKPVIAAVSGPAVAGGMELAIWADMRVMEETAYMGVYCRRWGVPLIDGGTVRLPRLVGEGRAMDLVLTGRRVEAEECLRIGLCEYVVGAGEARQKAEELAHSISAFPQSCMNSDRRSMKSQHGLSLRDALRQEWHMSKQEVFSHGIKGAGRFASGKGRGGDFDEF
ncbi:MAG: crotonase/enoyl-CoA hydratase family protein [Pseudomonadota bacterium]